ncbi:helix-turn-helix domain-containing protein, partial [Planctomycetota bacterium]
DLLYYGIPPGAGEPAGGKRLAEVERQEMIKALREFEGHRGKAAEYLGINRKTLREKIRKYGIEYKP